MNVSRVRMSYLGLRRLFLALPSLYLDKLLLTKIPFNLKRFSSNTRMKWSAILSLVLFVIVFIPFKPVISAARTVRVGIYENQPKVFVNEAGQPDGFFIDLLEEIARREGWLLNYTICEWEECLAALSEGEIDLMPDVAYTPQRDILFDFHRIPAAESWSRVYSNPNVRINRIDQLNGKTIAVLKESVQETVLEKTMTGYGFTVTIITAPTLEEVFKLVQERKADAGVVNHFFGDYNYPDYGLVRTSVIINATTLYYATSYGSNQDLLSAIDKYLDVWLDNPNSVYYSMTNRWLDRSARQQGMEYLPWFGIGVAIILVATVGWIFALRRQVKDRTQYLEVANQKLSESEKGYRLISTVTSDYMFSSKVETDGRLTLNWVAGAFEAITGYTLEEYIANGGWRATLYPEDYATDDQDMEKLKTNCPIETEIRTISKNGQTSWVHVYAHPVWDEAENRLTGVYGAVQDITERKKAEQKLHSANALLNITGKVAGVGGWEYDIDKEDFEGTEEIFNLFEIDHSANLSMDEAINYFSIEARSVLSEAVKRCLNDGTPWHLELPFVTGKGRKIWISVQGDSEREGNKPVRLFGAFQDITERKLAEERIRQQTSRAEALVRTASHINSNLELKSVLSAVCEETAHALAVPTVTLHMYDRGSRSLSIVADYGLPTSLREKMIDLPFNGLPVDMTPDTERVMIWGNIQDVPNLHNADFYNDVDLRSVISVRINNKDAYMGILSLCTLGEVRQFTDDEIALLEGLGNQAGQAIANAHLFEDIERQLKSIEALHTIDSAIANSMDVRLTLKVVAEETVKQLGVDAVDILLYKPASNQLETAVSLGFRTISMQKVTLQIGDGMAGQIATDWQQIFIQDLTRYNQENNVEPVFEGEGFISYSGIPLRAKGLLIGVLEVFKRTELNPDQEWFNFLETLAGQAAIAIDNIKSFEEIQSSNTRLMLAYDATIEGWSRAMDLRDEETEGHTQRVTQLTIQLARRLGISEAEIVHIRRGAILHDMGKLGIPDRILLKPDKLTEDEWVIMRKHPVYAYEMLSSIDYLRPALDIPYCHHEKWDGSGYPRGLKAEQIPLVARIFSVIDVWDALTSDRPYRPAWDRQRVLEYIEKSSGSHFDPAIVKAFTQEVARMNKFFNDD